jgi:hypothetical protein
VNRATPETPIDHEAVLAASYLFRNLLRERLSDCAARIRWQRIPRGTYICREGVFHSHGSGTTLHAAPDGSGSVQLTGWEDDETRGATGPA